ncbi:SGNH/GDSL hydrolase family protein, partial [Providencia rettgeri]
GLMISTLPHDNKYLVIGITPSLTDTKEDLENIRNINRILQDKYKSNFIDIWSELSKDGSIPRAMYSDDVHFNDLGYKAIAKIIEAKITQVQ